MLTATYGITNICFESLDKGKYRREILWLPGSEVGNKELRFVHLDCYSPYAKRLNAGEVESFLSKAGYSVEDMLAAIRRAE